MTEIETIIILEIINLIINTLAPLVLALSYFIRNISKSECCFGSKIEMMDIENNSQDEIVNKISHTKLK